MSEFHLHTDSSNWNRGFMSRTELRAQAGEYFILQIH